MRNSSTTPRFEPSDNYVRPGPGTRDGRTQNKRDLSPATNEVLGILNSLEFAG